MTDPLLIKNDKRFVLFPIIHPEFQEMYKKAVSCFWVPEEIKFSTDIIHLKSITPNERHFLMHVLSFFACSDGIVNENLALNFFLEIQSAEVRNFYGFQIFMENIHNETYSLMIDTFAKDEYEKNQLLNAMKTFPAIEKLSKWAFKWMNKETNSFAKRVVAFACIEGILFSGPFCSIYWFKKKGLMPGLSQANELISRDEGLHTDFACLLHNSLVEKASKDDILEIIKEVVILEKEFIIESLPCELLGMNSKEMSTYIEFVADRLLVALKCDKYYKVSNPFPWMDLISAPNKTNFFEKKVTEYSKDVSDNNNHKILLDDF